MGLKQIIISAQILFSFYIQFTLAGEKPARIVCYYKSWDNGTSFIPWDKCTHAIYSFLILDENTWRYKFIEYEDEIPPINRLQTFLYLKDTFPNINLLIAIGGYSDGGEKYSLMAEVAWRRNTFVQSIVEFLNEYEFDGLDLDWEYPGVDWTGGRPMDKDTFPLLIQDLRNAFNNFQRPLEITMAVSISEYVLGVGYDVPKICNIVDAVHLMVYDLRGPWDTYADVHSAIHARANGMEEYRNLNLDYGGPLWNRSGCPAHKLIVGVPFFGHEFTVRGVNKPGAVIDQNATLDLPDSGYMFYSTFCQRFTDSAWVKTFDYEVGCPYMTKGTSFFSYDDVESLTLKTDWIKQNGFGGVMVWAIDEDDHDGNCGPKAPLITTLYENLKNYNVAT